MYMWSYYLFYIFWIFKDRCVGKLKTMLTSLIYILILSINYFVTEKLVAIYDFYFVIIELIFGITWPINQDILIYLYWIYSLLKVEFNFTEGFLRWCNCGKSSKDKLTIDEVYMKTVISGWTFYDKNYQSRFFQFWQLKILKMHLY
jgi:hypothetical protein